MKNIACRRLVTQEEYQSCERLQQETWGFEDMSVVPWHLLTTFQKRGGLVLGAFHGQDMVGFVYGFVGKQGDQFIHNSVMCAVRPEYRNLGVAYRLKCEQRRLAMDQGFSLMTWTFDPLQSLNAHLNLNKLGAIGNEYLLDVYGAFRDELNQGLPTDRFSVAWWLNTPRVHGRMADPHTPTRLPSPTNQPQLGPQGLPIPEDRSPEVAGLNELHLAIPISIDELKRKNLDLALAWRYHSRAWFEAAFGAGFIAHRLTLDRQRKIGIYTLTKTDPDEILSEAS